MYPASSYYSVTAASDREVIETVGGSTLRCVCQEWVSAAWGRWPEDTEERLHDDHLWPHTPPRGGWGSGRTVGQQINRIRLIIFIYTQSIHNFLFVILSQCLELPDKAAVIVCFADVLSKYLVLFKIEVSQIVYRSFTYCPGARFTKQTYNNFYPKSLVKQSYNLFLKKIHWKNTIYKKVTIILK